MMTRSRSKREMNNGATSPRRRTGRNLQSAAVEHRGLADHWFVPRKIIQGERASVCRHGVNDCLGDWPAVKTVAASSLKLRESSRQIRALEDGAWLRQFPVRQVEAAQFTVVAELS